MNLTTMNPETRRLIKVTPEDAEKTAHMFDILLGDNIDGRKEIIATDETWEVYTSEILSSELYYGETVDKTAKDQYNLIEGQRKSKREIVLLTFREKTEL